MKLAVRLSIAGAAVALGVLGGIAAFAQQMDARRPRTLIVGPHVAGAPAERVDAARSGLTRSPLPAGELRLAWPTRGIGGTLDHDVLVDDAGQIYLYTTVSGGEVVVLAADGNEKWRTLTGGAASPLVLLSDGTVALVTARGDAVGIRRGAVRFRVRVGRPETTAPAAAPLPLDDGGFVVATSAELVALDAEGNIRARSPLSEPAAAPLVAALGKVYVVGVSGAVYQWALGKDPTRMGSFGGPIDGAAALSDDHTLVAVTQGNVHLDALDLSRGVLVTRAAALSGFFLGPPAMRSGTAYVVHYTMMNSYALALDSAGETKASATIAATPPPALADGGAVALTVPPHSGPIVDADGNMAFVSPEGQIGVMTKNGDVELLSDYPCSRGFIPGVGVRNTAARISPAESGAFIVACQAGFVSKVVSR